MANDVTRGYVSIASGQVHYRVRQGSAPAIVMLHQSTSSGAMFESTMRAYPPGRALYALDTPGFGGSFVPEGTPPMAEYGALLDETLDALGLRTCHVLGHHTGASIAVELAACSPAKLLSLALIGPVVLSREESAAFKSHYPKPFEPKPDGSHLKVIWDYLAELGAGHDLSLHHRELLDHALGWQGHVKVYSRIWDQDFGVLLAGVRCKLLLACAERDVLWPMFDRATALRPDATRIVLSGSNFEPDESPAEVASMLAGFVGDAA